MNDQEIVYVQVAYLNGEHVWEPLHEYMRNPPAGTWIVREPKRRRDS